MKCIVRADALNLHIYPVRTDMTATTQIPILRICSTDERKLEELLVDKTVSQVCSTDEDKSKGIIVNESSTEEGES